MGKEIWICNVGMNDLYCVTMETPVCDVVIEIYFCHNQLYHGKLLVENHFYDMENHFYDMEIHVYGREKETYICDVDDVCHGNYHEADPYDNEEMET